MPLDGRDGLIARFEQGYIPTSLDFRYLIDSSVNKKDDQFFGRWQRGMKYCHGDVVLYKKSLYMLNMEEAVPDCPPEEGEVEQTEVDKDDGCICSTEAPDKDQRWCLLELQMEDKDWKIVLDEQTGEAVIVYNVTANIGIGTENPATPLEVGHEIGSIQVDPNKGGIPAVSMVRFKNEEEGMEVDERVDMELVRQMQWNTNSIGYAFFRLTEEEAQDIAKEGKTKQTLPTEQEPLLLLFVSSNDQGTPQVGIGTDEPRGSLDVQAPDRGRMMVHPFAGSKDAAALLINTEPAGNGHYLLSGINQDVAYIQTDANQGLRIIQGNDVSTLEKTMGVGTTSVAIDQHGNVGVGTETPRSKMELTNGQTGTVRIDFSQDNVCVSTINERPSPQHVPTYAALGVDDDFATLITDAPRGVVVKAGQPIGEGNLSNEVNINQGDNVAFISPEGRMGLRTMDVPEDYDLDVAGQVRSLTAFLHTDSSTIQTLKEIHDEDILEKVLQLKPIRFKFKKGTNAVHEGDQFGLKGSNVFEHLPELVKKTGSHKSVAYGNLTAVLVQAIQDQQALIADLERRVCDLEEQLNPPQQAAS